MTRNSPSSTFPNTAGAHTAEEAVRIAEIAQHAGLCNMIKVEVIGDDKTLLPDPSAPSSIINAGRIGHITEARVLESMGVDYIDESEVLTPADEEYHLKKDEFQIYKNISGQNEGL